MVRPRDTGRKQNMKERRRMLKSLEYTRKLKKMLGFTLNLRSFPLAKGDKNVFFESVDGTDKYWHCHGTNIYDLLQKNHHQS
jgi:hypothetical protein